MIHPKINQRWVVKNKDGEVLKRLRILGPSPLGALQYLFITEPAKMIYHPYFGAIDVEVLEKTHELEQDVCEHKRTDDYYSRDSPIPTHYICDYCGDTFPVIGDTDFWFPKVLKAKSVLKT